MRELLHQDLLQQGPPQQGHISHIDATNVEVCRAVAERIRSPTIQRVPDTTVRLVASQAIVKPYLRDRSGYAESRADKLSLFANVRSYYTHCLWQSASE